MENRFAPERHIEQIKSKLTGAWSFRVRIKNRPDIPARVFSETEYNSVSIAWQNAKAYRDQCVGLVATKSSVKKKLNKNVTLRDVFDGMQEMFHNAYETRRKEEIRFNKYIGNGAIRFCEIDRQYIQNNINQIADVASDDVILKVKTIWNKMYRYACDEDIVGKDCSRNIILPKSRISQKPHREAMTDEDTLNRVIEYCRNNLQSERDKKNYPLFLITAYYTGLRPAELFALQKRDVILGGNNPRIIVHQSLSQKDKSEYDIGNVKNADSSRVVPIASNLVPYLEEAIKYNCSRKNGFLFINAHGQPYNSKSVSDRLDKAGKIINVDFNMYQLRHYFVQRLLDNGVPFETVQAICGHKNASTTLSYARSTTAKNKDAISLLDVKLSE